MPPRKPAAKALPQTPATQRDLKRLAGLARPAAKATTKKGK